MRLFISVIYLLAACVSGANAQTTQPDQQKDSAHSTGRTVSPDTTGQQTPQGPSGPLETKTGGAPASSPQGQTPPGMQSAPEGSSKTIVDPPKK